MRDGYGHCEIYLDKGNAYYEGGFDKGKVGGTGKAIDLNDTERVAIGVFDEDYTKTKIKISKVKINKKLYGSYEGQAK